MDGCTVNGGTSGEVFIEDVAFEMQTSAMAGEEVMLFDEVVAAPGGGEALRGQHF